MREAYFSNISAIAENKEQLKKKKSRKINQTYNYEEIFLFIYL